MTMIGRPQPTRAVLKRLPGIDTSADLPRLARLPAMLHVQALVIRTIMLFGWRTFSRLSVDFRKKDAQARQRLQLIRALFMATIKLDIQFEVRSGKRSSCSKQHVRYNFSQQRLSYHKSASITSQLHRQPASHVDRDSEIYRDSEIVRDCHA